MERSAAAGAGGGGAAEPRWPGTLLLARAAARLRLELPRPGRDRSPLPAVPLGRAHLGRVTCLRAPGLQDEGPAGAAEGEAADTRR